MKRSDVINALVREANEAITGNLTSKHGIPLNTHSDSFTVLLSLRSICSPLFGFDSPEYALMGLYLDSFQGKAFIGPLAVQP